MSPKGLALRLPTWGSLGVRTQILGWYVLVVAGVLALSVIAVRRSIDVATDERIDAAIAQEIAELRRISGSVVEAQREAAPAERLAAVYDAFMQANVPDRGEMFIAIVEGTPVEISADAPAPLHEDAAFVATVNALTSSAWLDVRTAAGPARVLAVPTTAQGASIGVFAVARFTKPDRLIAADAARRTTLTSIAALLAVSGLAWLVAGRVLRPLSSLATRAREVSESTLDQELEPRGATEIASLIGTFNTMLRRLRRAFRSQKQFLDDAAHELRTPLTVVRGHIELATEAAQMAATRTLVLDEIDRMARIVDDLGVIAQAEQPDFMKPAPIDLDEFLAGIVQRAQMLGPQDWRLATVPPVVVELDIQRISQALLNLAGNAARHTPPGKVVEIGAEHNDRVTRIWVRDEGEGIAAADHERVFERFARGSTQRAPGGSGGLGLAIVKAIAVAHGGHVELRSEIAKGSTFTLSLPHNPATEAAGAR